ncbi:MAG TPA: hypothetical protein VGK00_17830 [Anaerolineales bacterium]|jgi:hypothetical protein
MSPEFICPFCGAPLENSSVSTCPSCGSALSTRPGSTPLEASPRPEFNNSAEVMDEVKDLIREGDLTAAAGVAASAFGLDTGSAQSTVEQVQIEMQHSGHETPPRSESTSTPPAPQVIDAPGYETPKKSSNAMKWIIGSVIGATILLCVCCLLTVLLFVPVFRTGQ